MGKTKMGAYALALFGIILPPLAVAFDRGCSMEFLISILLWICIPEIGGVLYAFHVFEVPLIKNLLALFLPPVAAFLQFDCGCEFWLSLILTCCGILPGIIYTYYVLVDVHYFRSRNQQFANP